MDKVIQLSPRAWLVFFEFDAKVRTKGKTIEIFFGIND